MKFDVRHQLFVVGLLMIGCAGALRAESENCVPDGGCAKGKWPPKCCKPPRCEFWEAYVAARAKADVIDSLQAAGGEFELAPLGTKLVDLVSFRNRVGEEIGKWQRKAPKCPNSSIDEPPIFSVMPGDECRIKGKVGSRDFVEMNYMNARSSTNACEEVVNARYKAAEARSKGGTCFLEQNFPNDYHARLAEFKRETRREAEELERELKGYWFLCSIVFDNKTARRVAKEGLGALRGAEPMKFRPKARRSGQSGRRG